MFLICKKIWTFVIILAISDGILNNDAFKHNSGEDNNEKWNNHLRNLKFYEEKEDHIMYLRQRFVLGAADWMAGENGSKQNYKLLFGYTDAEWEYIWTTMLEDGAWAVPSIQNKEGEIIKENWAPEILIKFIAHEIKCHIIVFDLQLNRVQFISGNHVVSDNVKFDSPLLIYATGSHFQSVLQTDHEYFKNYVIELEIENNSDSASDKKGNIPENNPSSSTSAENITESRNTKQSRGSNTYIFIDIFPY